MRILKALVIALALLGCGLVGARPAGAQVPQGASGEFTALPPQRILDTRNGTGGVPAAPIGPRGTVNVQVTGRGGVPATGVSAVVLNATVTQPTAGSWVTIFPTGSNHTHSNLNFDAGQTVANLVTVPVDANGRVSAFNQFGSTHVIFDVAGYYSTMLGTAGARYVAAVPPQRLFDTRTGGGGAPVGRVTPGNPLHYHLEGAATGSTPGITAVILNVTAVEPTAGGWLTVYPDDAPMPLASNVNFPAGRDVPNLVTVRVPPNGNIAFQTALGAAHLVVDVVGSYRTGITTEQGRFVSITPARVADSRSFAPVQAGTPRSVKVTGGNGVPESADAVVLNVTATEPTANGWFTVFPSDYCTLPPTSNLNFVAGQTVPNAVITPVSKPAHQGCSNVDGAITISNPIGATHYILDVFGYFTPA